MFVPCIHSSKYILHFLLSELSIYTLVPFCAGPTSAPTDLRAMDIMPTSVKFSWSRPKWKQSIHGYKYLLLAQAHVIRTSALKPSCTSVSIQSLSPGMNSYEFRVAGILQDGIIGRFSSSLKVDHTLPGEQNNRSNLGILVHY